MQIEETIGQIEKYLPFNEQEKLDKKAMMAFLKNNPDAFSRSNLAGHMTASCWIVNKERNKTLFAYHNIYQSYAWLGGHADEEIDLLKVALKEAKEESGLKSIRPLSKEIFSLEILGVDGHVKKGKYVSSHLHYNVTYLFEADEKETLEVKIDENSSLKWFSFEEALKASKEPWFVERIYKKLIEKTKAFREKSL